MPAIFPAFEDKVDSSEDFGGHGRSDGLEQLDALAATLGLTPLSHFIDSHAMAESFFDEAELADVSVPPVQWHAAEVGLATAKGLYDYLQANPSDTSVSNAAQEDLRNLAALLARAMQSSIGFHLLVDI